MFIIEGKTIEKINYYNYAAGFLDGDGNLINGMNKIPPCYNFSASDKGTQTVVNAYPNMLDLNGEIGANKDFTFIC